MKKSPTSGHTLRIHVLDTNVLMHDPQSLFHFAEHDVFIPLEVLEELDNHKKGHTEVSRNSRAASRIIDGIFSSETVDMEKGISLSEASGGAAKGNLLIQTRSTAEGITREEQPGKADNRILALVEALKKERRDREIILVSNDTNMRIKARALGIRAEEYRSDKVIEDADLLYTGIQELPSDFFETHSEGLNVWKEKGGDRYRVSGPIAKDLILNQFVWLEDQERSLRVCERFKHGAVLSSVHHYRNEKEGVWGIRPRNPEQNYALNLLLDPEIDLITIVGKAGSGKTLLTLAAGLSQVFDSQRYSDIIFTRITVPVGEDIGFLPGTEEEKMAPWMGALNDNLDVLHNGDETTEWGKSASRDLIRTRIQVKSLNFMRGRTFLKKFVIIDEAQNLTPKQIKTLITRAGPGTKVVCLGNLAQIDTPYLTEESSGLTYLVENFKGWKHSGHITLFAGERSRLVNHANEVLK